VLSATLLKQKIYPAIESAFQKVAMKGVERDQFRKISNDEVVPDSDAYYSAKTSAERLAKEIARDLSEALADQIVAHIKMGVVSSDILPGTIPTAGSPGSPVGPLAPVKIAGTIK